MLPKEEKISKKKIDTDQPGLFDKENEKDKLIKKRRIIYIALSLTAGLSFIFWVYSSFKNLNFSFKLPSFNFSNVSQVSQPESTFKLPKDPNASWSVFLKRTDSPEVILQKNENLIFSNQDLNSISDELNKADFTSNSSYTASLPQGIKLKEIIKEDQNNFSYFSKIIIPNEELFIFIKISNSKNLSQSKQNISNLIDQLYWYSRQK